jgi:lysozyme
MKRRTRWTILLLLLVLLLTGSAVLGYLGILWPNRLFASEYPVHGIDVSNHQKDIDWEKVSRNESVGFAYIKATEGDDYRDAYFEANWNGATSAGIPKGAYHYFTVASSGARQAANFIATVPIEAGSLPPVVDVEVGGTDPTAFRRELQDFLDAVETAYHQKPVIYTDYTMYEKYIGGTFDEYDLWIRAIVVPPSLARDREWTFWQFCNRGRVDGIDGYVDLDVFVGSGKDLLVLETK